MRGRGAALLHGRRVGARGQDELAERGSKGRGCRSSRTGPGPVHVGGGVGQARPSLMRSAREMRTRKASATRERSAG